MKVFAHDLALARDLYAAEDRSPEMTLALPKGAATPSPGDRITLHNKRVGYGGVPTAECEAEVVSLAVVVRPDWSTFCNPYAEREQGSLL